MKVQSMNCQSLEELNFALTASWCGCAVIANYNGLVYNLYCDIDDSTCNGSHKSIMALIPNHMQLITVEPAEDIIEVDASRAVESFFTW